MLLCATVYAQDVVATPGSTFVLDLGTFTGIVAVVSALVTQIAKVLPVISANNLLKIVVSAVTGIVVCLLCWVLNATPLLVDLAWWQSILYGLAAGLAGCGFYDIIKALGGVIKK